MSFTVFLWDVEFFNLVTVIKIVFSGFIIKLLPYGRLYAPSPTPALRLKSDIIVKVSKLNCYLYLSVPLLQYRMIFIVLNHIPKHVPGKMYHLEKLACFKITILAWRIKCKCWLMPCVFFF